MAELGSVRDSTSSGKKRIFAIVSRPIAAEPAGLALLALVMTLPVRRVRRRKAMITENLRGC